MYPSPGSQGPQRSDDARRFRTMNDQMDAQRRRRARGGSGSGLGGLLKLLILVAVVVFLARNPELRNAIETFARNLLAHVQS